jgi:hypothetical protein
MNRLSHAVFLAFCASLIFFAGCNSDPRAKVSGKVTYKGTAVPGGTVVFQTEDGLRSERVAIGKDGSYTSTNVPVGSCRIGVEPAPKGARAFMPKSEKPKITDEAVAKMYEKDSGEYVDIPASLRDPTKSQITFKVEPGDNTFDVILNATADSKGSGGFKGSMK